MAQISITVDGAALKLEADQRPTHIFADNKEVVVCRVNGALKDLWTELSDGDVVESIVISSPDGLAVLRHSTAHVMAQAVQEVYANTRLGIGPPIKDGFYYDFDPVNTFNPDDLVKIESAMRKIVKEGQRFRRRVTTEAEALKELAHEPYKCELIGIKGPAGEEASVEVGGSELTIYDNLGRDGNPVWSDLCRGPHLPSTKHIPAFKLMRTAAAYWRGSEKNPMLQRIYGTAWPSQDELNAYLELLAEAEKRDHRRLGTELDLFSFPEEIGSGLAVFHPKGGIVRRAMEDYSRIRHEEENYEFVYSPHLTKAALFETSGHLQWYADGMYPPMILDEELNADGTVRKPGQQYYMKPMNCPFHNLIYKSRGRSYRELPLRLFEFGTVYRYEKSGVLHGITRARGFTQDDAHIFCREDQIVEEVQAFCALADRVYKEFGFTYSIKLALRPEQRFGSDADWDKAENELRAAVVRAGLATAEFGWEELPGEGAFYAPKLEWHLTDAIGRTWQVGTIQSDRVLPERLDASYVGEDGARHRPVMLHRAIFGSYERFIGILIEHYAGRFPVWLAPVQAVVATITSEADGYAHDVTAKLKAAGIRVETDTHNEKINYKVREHSVAKVPHLLVVGMREAEEGKVAIRSLGSDGQRIMTLEEAIAMLKYEATPPDLR